MHAIETQGKALDSDVLLVDSFLNHQVDVSIMEEAGETFAKAFAGVKIDRVATIESSGIAPAAFTARALGVPLVIMKKQTSRIMTGEAVHVPVRSFTKGTVYELMCKKAFLPEGDSVLFIDDFLASGEAAFGAMKIFEMCGCQLAGIGILIEKSFQAGREKLQEKGIRTVSLARVASMETGHVSFLPADA